MSVSAPRLPPTAAATVVLVLRPASLSTATLEPASPPRTNGAALDDPEREAEVDGDGGGAGGVAEPLVLQLALSLGEGDSVDEGVCVAKADDDPETEA